MDSHFFAFFTSTIMRILERSIDMNKIEKAFKISKIAYYSTMVVLGVVETVVFGAFYLACTRKEKEEESNDDSMECN